MIERRFSLIESMVSNMDQKLNILSKKRDERDSIVLELFKMLQNSLETRRKMISEYNHLIKQMESDNKRESPRNSILRRKK